MIDRKKEEPVLTKQCQVGRYDEYRRYGTVRYEISPKRARREKNESQYRDDDVGGPQTKIAA